MKPEEVIRHYNALKEDYLSRRSFMVRERIDEISKEVISILEKQIGKKPKKLSYEPLIKHGWEYECPECGKAIGLNSVGFDFTDEDPFCPSCGQKIDWSEEE